MIKEHCFTEEWLDAFKKQKEHNRIDKIILEKMIYALHLLERIKTNGLNFVFKGGTSLVLLLEEGNRFSIDIDIICKIDRETLETILQKVVDSSNFKSFELDARRSYLPGVPKAHYAFAFDSSNKGKYFGTILLDVLIEKSLYPELTERPIQTKWAETEGETLITLPSIDAITGDKLTAFAPNTIGIPYFKGKDNQSFSMEICKQLFDLSKLFEKLENIEVVADSFQAFAKQEIEYRKPADSESYLTPKIVLIDTINTCLILAKKGTGTADEQSKFRELQNGIKAFGSGFLIAGNFRIDDAIPASARIAYLSAKILYNNLSSLEYFNGQDIKELNIENQDWNFLNRLKKQPDKSSFYYWYKTLEVMKLIKKEIPESPTEQFPIIEETDSKPVNEIVENEPKQDIIEDSENNIEKTENTPPNQIEKEEIGKNIKDLKVLEKQKAEEKKNVLKQEQEAAKKEAAEKKKNLKQKQEVAKKQAAEKKDELKKTKEAAKNEAVKKNNALKKLKKLQ